MQYNHKSIEKKWQDFWSQNKIYTTADSVPGKENFFLLVEFPYPSGNLHVGHWYAFAVPDILARFHRMQGKNVLYPIGFDAFGLPAENAAIKNKVNPRTWTDGNIAFMKGQIESMGTSFDWSRELATYTPDYYKWTQWLFLKLYEKGLVYQKETAVNWCPNDKTVLANEQVVDGKCERCGHTVEQRQMLQWNIKITDYADRLIDDLDPLDWPNEIKESQKNWIGRSEGAEIDFALDFGTKPGKVLIIHGFEGSPDGGWKPWLKAELEKLGWEVRVPQLPNAAHPNYEETMVFLREQIKDFTENDTIVGHSLGGHFALKLAEEKKIGQVTLVAPAIGGFDLPYEEWERDFPESDNKALEITLKTAPVDFSKVQAKRKFAIFGEVDDGIPLRHADELEKRDFKVVKLPGTGHMSKELKVLEIFEYVVGAIRVFTTRPDTLFGATYLVLAPEHPWVTLALGHKTVLQNNDEVAAYVERTTKMSDLDRQTNKEKTGVQLKGVEALNPATGEKIPLFISDYVLPQYGTGAIMAVPAHDERDYEFAKKFNLPIKEVVIPIRIDEKNPHVEGKEVVFRNIVMAIVRDPKADKYLALEVKDQKWTTFVIGGIEEGEDVVSAARREVVEESGYKNLKLVRVLGGAIHSEFYAAHKGVNRVAHNTTVYFELENDEREDLSPEEAAKHSVIWLDLKDLTRDRMSHAELDIVLERLRTGNDLFTDAGILMNSGDYDGLTSGDAKKKMIEACGRKKTTFRLRDWIVSRQRYWGVPIPMIHCQMCGSVPVPDAQLPVILPEVEDYLPEGTGKSPLAKVDSFVNVSCPKCGGSAKRETDTFDTFVDSSWYFLRYTDPKNTEEFASRAKQDAWMPVDLYSGGAEHTTMHLLYSRFWHKALFDMGLVKDPEPYKRRMNRSLIMGPDGQKMSKSRGNVIDPDEVVKMLGADTVRMYMAFMGPYGEVSSYPWNPDGVVGVRRFLERMARNEEYVQDSDVAALNGPLHKALKKIGEDIIVMKFNTAVSQLMILQNAIEKEKKIGQEQLMTMVQMLAPFAPHLAEELWHLLGNESSVHTQTWPTVETKYLTDEEVTVAVQIDGKTRGEFTIASDADKAAMEAAAREAVAARLEGKTVARTIVVPKRLVNFVLEA